MWGPGGSSGGCMGEGKQGGCSYGLGGKESGRVRRVSGGGMEIGVEVGTPREQPSCPSSMETNSRGTPLMGNETAFHTKTQNPQRKLGPTLFPPKKHQKNPKKNIPPPSGVFRV